MDWMVKPCSHDAASVLAQALGLSETTARVLVRRGYDDPDEARVFLEDGDRVTMPGWCQGLGYRVGFGEVTGRILPALG